MPDEEKPIEERQEFWEAQKRADRQRSLQYILTTVVALFGIMAGFFLVFLIIPHEKTATNSLFGSEFIQFPRPKADEIDSLSTILVAGSTAILILITGVTLNWQNRIESSRARSRLLVAQNYDFLSERKIRPRFGLIESIKGVFSGDNIPSAPWYISPPGSYLELLEQFRYRMFVEEQRLRANSTWNLIWGILFSSAAIFLLGISIISAHLFGPVTVGDLVFAYAPRISLAVILELVSFFFLRLYSAVEQEIKHNKNEITNLESKIMAALIAKSVKNDAAMMIVIKSLSSVERNFILRRWERTAGFEGHSEKNDLNDLLERIAKLVPSQPSQ